MAAETRERGRVYGGVGRGKRWLRRQSTLTALLVLLAGACSLSLPDGDDIDAAVDDAVDSAGTSVTDVLAVLFPDLSDDEVADLSVSLSLDEVLALRDELEAARDEAAEFSLDLFQSSEERVEERRMALEPTNGFPESLEALGSVCLYDEASQEATIALSGVFSGQTPIQLTSANVTVTVDGQVQAGLLSCLHMGQSVDIVLLVDITGSMSSVIGSVRDSVVTFTQSIHDSGLNGTLSVVTFQDTVGVDVTFQEPAPAEDYERSPFFPPVDIGEAAEVEALQDFVRALEANRGADAPENLSGAIDFARSSVIGGSETDPLVVSAGSGPRGTRPFPELESARQVFIALTDITFHSDETSSTSLLPEFRPREAGVIARSLQRTGTVVHVVDPSWVDEQEDPGFAEFVDADFWANQTGGLGKDVVLGYSLLDLELVAVAEDTGLLDVVLDAVLATSCSFEFTADLSGEVEVEVQLEAEGEVFTEILPVTSF